MIRPSLLQAVDGGFGRSWPYEGKVGDGILSRRCHWRGYHLACSSAGATDAGRHEARVCIVCIISSPFTLLARIPFLVPSLFSHYSFTVSALLQAYNHHQRYVAYGLPSHFLGQSIHQLGGAFIRRGIQPSIAFWPSLCHNCCPSPLEPQESKPSSVCCLTPYGLLLPYRLRVVSRPSNAHRQIYHARDHAIRPFLPALASALH